MQTSATVLEIGTDRARVACVTEAGCGACRAGRGCALRWIGGGRPALDVPLVSADGGALRPGQGVVLEVPDAELLRAAARAYLPPLAGVLLAPLALRLAGGGELLALLGTLAGLGAGWTVARFWFRRSPPQINVRVQAAPDA